jgi:hypothetical protein
MCTNSWLESLKGGYHSEDSHKWDDNIEVNLKKIGGVMWTGLCGTG